MGNTQDGVPAHVVDELAARLPGIEWRGVRWVHGAFHHVALTADLIAVRVRTGRNHRDAIEAEAGAMRQFSGLRLAVAAPTLANGPVHGEGWSAFACTRIHGASMEVRTWHDDRRAIFPMLEELAGVDVEAARGFPAPRSWCGGSGWEAIVSDMTRGWDPTLRSLALAGVRAVVEDQRPRRGVSHGDFGPHNILVTATGPALIDLDNVCAGEDGLDVAPLLAHYPFEDLRRDFSHDTLGRAATVRRSLPLQVAAAAELAGDVALRDHALANFVRRTTT